MLFARPKSRKLVLLAWVLAFVLTLHQLANNNGKYRIAVSSSEQTKLTSTVGKYRIAASSSEQTVHSKQHQEHEQLENAFTLTERLQLISNSTTLPPWMQDYLAWHAQQRQAMKGQEEFSNWNFLILRCASQDRCGGVSDRLTSIPLFLLLAACTDRVLLFRWDRPFPLEEFLVPGPMMNWSVPKELQTILDRSINNETRTNHSATTTAATNYVYGKRAYFDGQRAKKLITAAGKRTTWLVEGNVHTGGENLMHLVMQKHSKGILKSALARNDADYVYATFYHEMFASLFTPTPPIQRLVSLYMSELKLVPNQFVVAHYRAKYPGEPYRQTWNLTILEETVIHAVQCASSLAPQLPVYVASDAVAALHAVQRYRSIQRQQAAANNSKNQPSTAVVAVSHLDISKNMSGKDGVVTTTTKLLLPQQDPPHLNFDTSHENDPSGFYSIFVDLLIMASSRCVSFGAGGFGRLGSLLSFNASCRVAHSNRGKLEPCPAPLL